MRVMGEGWIFTRQGLEKTTREYTETLEPGFSYVYKITMYNRSKISGKDSNLIKFRFPVPGSENNTLMEKKE